MIHIHKQTGQVVQVNSVKADKDGMIWLEKDGKTEKISYEKFVKDYTLGVKK